MKTSERSVLFSSKFSTVRNESDFSLRRKPRTFLGHKLQLPGQDSEDRKTPVLGALPPLDHEMENLGAVIMDTLTKLT